MLERMGEIEFTECYESGCTAPCEVLDRFWLRSTDGPIEHVRTLCLAQHRYLGPTRVCRGVE